MNASAERAPELRTGRAGRARGRAALLVLPLLAAALLFGAALPAWAASTTDVKVQGIRVYTPTGITVHAGDQVHVTANGNVNFGGGRIAKLQPPGVKWGDPCQAIAAAKRYRNPWPAAGISCWSLIAKVGSTAPIFVGSDQTFTANADGPLFLGVNDNFVRDNSGSWDAQVTVTPPT